jgi:hypothetical protein
MRYGARVRLQEEALVVKSHTTIVDVRPSTAWTAIVSRAATATASTPSLPPPATIADFDRVAVEAFAGWRSFCMLSRGARHVEPETAPCQKTAHRGFFTVHNRVEQLRGERQSGPRRSPYGWGDMKTKNKNSGLPM